MIWILKCKCCLRCKILDIFCEDIFSIFYFIYPFTWLNSWIFIKVINIVFIIFEYLRAKVFIFLVSTFQYSSSPTESILWMSLQQSLIFILYKFLGQLKLLQLQRLFLIRFINFFLFFLVLLNWLTYVLFSSRFKWSNLFLQRLLIRIIKFGCNGFNIFILRILSLISRV